MIKNKSIDIQKKENISMCSILLFLEILLCFLANHSALFIADYYILLVIFIGCMLIRSNMKIQINPLMLSLGIVVVSSLLFFNIMGRGTFLSYIIWLIVMIFSLEHKFSNNELALLMWGFILGSLIMSILLIIQQHHYKYEGSFRFTIQILNNEEVDPNYLASFIYIGVVFSLYQFVNKVGKMKIISLGIGIIEMFAIFQTGSRAAYLALVFLFIGLFFNKSSSQKSTSKLLMLIAIVFLLIVAAFMLSEDVLNRFDFSTLMDASNLNRLQHWKAAAVAFFKNPLLGYGASHTMSILSTYANHLSDAHNTFFTILLHFGLIGSIPIFSLFFKIFSGFRNKRSNEWLFYFIGFLFINFIVANHLGISFWLPILIFYQISSRKEFENVECSGSGI